jgi:hypothetical protein
MIMFFSDSVLIHEGDLKVRAVLVFFCLVSENNAAVAEGQKVTCRRCDSVVDPCAECAWRKDECFA